MKNNNYTCHAPYVRNCIAYDHDFWYTCVKWWYSRPFFHFFEIFVFQAVRGVKGKNGPRWQKNYVWCTSYLRNDILYYCYLWYTCVKDDISRYFFHFFKILILWVVRGGGGEEVVVKGQRRSKIEKKFCLLYSISQESYIIWFLFMVLMFKMIIPPQVFFIFSKF